MIRRHVLAALAAGIAAGDDDAARLALRRIDPVLRRPARRRLEAALIDSALHTTELGSASDPEAARHVQRVAALTIARAPHVDVMDRERVAAAYRALPATSVSRAPVVTVAFAVALAAIATAITVMFVFGHSNAPRTYERPLPTPVAGAFKDGGVPLRDAEIEQLLIGPFTDLVIETDRDRRTGGLDRARKAHNVALLAPPVITARGPALAAAWRELIVMLDRWVTVPASTDGFDEITRDLRHRVRAVSDQLAAAGIGYYLEGDVFTSTDTAHATVYTYRVEEVAFVLAGTQPRRVLSLRRLDAINMQHSLLGMQSQDLGDPVLLVDQIEEHVARKLVPVLAPDASYDLGDPGGPGDDDWALGSEGKAIARVGGAAVRTELLRVLGADADRATQIAALIAERRAIVDGWSSDLERRHLRIPAVDALFLPPSLLDSLEPYVPQRQLARVHELEDQVAALDGPRIASRCHQLLAASVRRHEAQHGLDDDRAQPLRYPAVLEQLLGPPTDGHDRPIRAIDRARAELSAYVSQLANDVQTPQLALWNVVGFAFNRRTWGTPESYAGVLLAEGLARQLHLASAGPVIHDHAVDRARLATLMLGLSAIGGDQLRAATRAVWLELYGEPPVAIVDR